MHFSQAFTLEKVREALALATQCAATPPQSPPIGFIPIGRHVIRWFLGPEGDSMRAITVHHDGSRLRTHCPACLQDKNPQANYPECAICQLANQHHDWRAELKFLYLNYGLLLETNNTKSYWQPGQVYIIAGREPLKKALKKLAQSLSDDYSDVLAALFNPHVEGYATQVSLQPGSQRYPVEIQPLLDRPCPPIALGDWYQPLSQCWLSEEFSVKDYEEVLAAFTHRLV